MLREKRDALIAEFLDVVCEVRNARKAAEDKLKEAFKSLIIAQALLGVEQVRQLSLMTPQEISMDFSSQSIMGVHVPALELKSGLVRAVTERGYGFRGFIRCIG